MKFRGSDLPGSAVPRVKIWCLIPRMTSPKRWFVKSSIFLWFFPLVLTSVAFGQNPETSATRPALFFNATPAKQILARGEAVVFALEIYNGSAEPIFVSRLKGNELVKFSVTGPDGKDVPWQGQGRTDHKAYSSSDFAVLQPYHLVNADRIISLNDGAGFVFDKTGQYSATAEYSQAPAQSFAPSAAGAKVPTGSFRSTKTAFCIEVCVLGPSTSQVHNNASHEALEAVRVFYTYITKYQPLGVPQGRAKRALWPLMSKRLAHELDSFQACDDDYYRRYGAVLKANQYKPATPWLEEGLFSGFNEAATPMKFAILDSKTLGENRADVHLGFTYEQTYCCGDPTAYEHYEGVVTVILENNRWLIDDFVALGSGSLLRLSDGYSECKGGQWVNSNGEPPY